MERLVPQPFEILAQLQRISNDATFAKGGSAFRFLQYVVTETMNGRGAEISERGVAEHVFHKKSNWDPKTDTIVRTNANILRKKLSDHYKGDGVRDPVLISFPSSGYTPAWVYNAGGSIYPPLPENVRELFCDAKTALIRRSRQGIDAATAFVSYARALSAPRSIATPLGALVLIAGGYGYNVPSRDVYGYAANQLQCAIDDGGDLSWEFDFVSGICKAAQDYDWNGALECFEKARANSNRESSCFWWHGALLAAHGRFDEAIALLKDALDAFDSKCLPLHIDLIMIYGFAARYEEGVRQMRIATEILGNEPNHLFYFASSMLLESAGNLEKACLSMRSSYTLSPECSILSHIYHAYVIAKTEGKETADEIFNALKKERSRPDTEVSAMELAFVAVAGDRLDEAVDWLQTAVYVDHDQYLLWIGLLPAFRPLHKHPGFLWLLKKLRLPLPPVLTSS